MAETVVVEPVVVEPVVVEPVVNEQRTCVECNQAIQEGQRATQAPCEHFFHTDCFTLLITQVHDRHRRCRQCNEDIVQVPAGDFENLDEAYMMRRERRHLRQLWDTNREFKNDIKAYTKAVRLQNKQVTAVKKIVAQKKQEYNEQWTMLKNQIQALYDQAKASILQTQEYKEYKKSITKVTRLKKQFLERYHIDNMWTLHRVLKDKPGMRRIGRPSYQLRSTYIIMRGFRFRIKP